jgi:hypothetical protein
MNRSAPLPRRPSVLRREFDQEMRRGVAGSRRLWRRYRETSGRPRSRTPRSRPPSHRTGVQRAARRAVPPCRADTAHWRAEYVAPHRSVVWPETLVQAVGVRPSRLDALAAVQGGVRPRPGGAPQRPARDRDGTDHRGTVQGEVTGLLGPNGAGKQQVPLVLGLAPCGRNPVPLEKSSLRVMPHICTR